MYIVHSLLIIIVVVIYFNYIKFKIGDDTTNVCNYLNLSRKELAQNSVINMTFVMYYNGIFYMRDKSFGKSFSLMCSMIKEYCDLNLHPYLPHNEEVCLGKFPGIFYF